MTFLKLLIIAIVLFFMDRAFRIFLETYVINNWDFVHTAPGGFFDWIPYLAVIIGWTYLLVVLVFHFVKRRLKNQNRIMGSFLGVLLFVFAFLFYWVDDFGTDYGTYTLLEGLIVYLVLGFVMDLLYNIFMRESK